MDTAMNPLQNPTTTRPETIVQELNKSKYIPGQPLDYRFNCKDGTIYRNGRNIGQNATLHILACRVMEGQLFGKDSLWIEAFFKDDSGNIGSTLFNSHSAEEFKRFLSQLFYEEIKLSQAVIDVNFQQKTGSNDGTSYTYHILSFSLKERLDASVEKEVAEFTKEKRHLYRSSTLVDSVKVIASLNFYTPEPNSEKASSKTVVTHPASEKSTVNISTAVSA
ncbi:hypothetical protein [Tunicatimonas pelagia]|uniref:hypothetical protein n=1 Tax=Tunicatimonas pelagia TaxID=931531 RepID=UPI002665C447|nr:hypothetical protein [Tunicatimonas pelagia]WKN46454.1 hypothetical protein P0M28_30865 [Tunicatimonas pelagia]